MRLFRLAFIAVFCVSCSRHRVPERWQAVAIPTDAEFNGMWFSDSLNGWITGGGYDIPGGIVGRTRDGGQTWRFRNGVAVETGAGFGLHRVQFRDVVHGWVANDDGVLLTEDGGESWRRATGIGGDGPALFDVQFIDAGNGWAVGTSRLIRTEDGGETWRTLVKGAYENGYFSGNAVHFLDARHGWLAGRDGTLMRSDDGGQTWTPVALPLRAGERPTLWDLTFSDALHGWTVGDSGSIFHTDDGGENWTLQEHGVPVIRVIPKGEPLRPREVVPELETEPDRLCISAVHFIDSNQGCAAGYYADVAESIVMRTRDGGANWEVERVQPGEILRAVFVLDSTHAWAVGDRVRTPAQVVLRYVDGTR